MRSEVKNLMFDFAAGKEIFDAEQNRVITKSEVNDVIRNACFEHLGLSEKATDKQIKRALKSEKAVELFEVIEEVIEREIAIWMGEDTFMNEFVEMKNMNDGDRNEFWVDDEVILTVHKMAGDHHDITSQRLGAGSSFAVPTDVYGIKVGTDIRLFLLGKRDWSQFVNAVAKAYQMKIQDMIAAEFTTGTNKLTPPSKLADTGVLGQATKANFDALIEKVELANGCPVCIMGTKTALRSLNALTTVVYADPANSVKEAVANTGIIGNYEGTAIMVLPQKFKDNLLTSTNMLIDNKKLYIMPMVDNKFIKMVDYGETELQIDEIGATMDDAQSLEVQRRMGVATVMTRYFGIWTL